MTKTDAIAIPTAPTRRLPVARVVVIFAAVAVLLALGRVAGGYLPRFAAWVDGLGAWGPLVFIFGYAAAVVAFVPGSILTLAAGAIFGLVKGTAYVLVAATLGAAPASLIARNVARGAIEHRIAGNARFAAIARAVA